MTDQHELPEDDDSQDELPEPVKPDHDGTDRPDVKSQDPEVAS